MKVDREKSNPIIRIGDLKPSRPDFEIIGVFNAGVAEFREKTILLVRVAEKPISESNTTVSVPIYNPERGEIEILRLQRENEEYDFSDPRVIRSKYGRNFLTSISHIRYAESRDGVHFTVDDHPLIYPMDEYTSFGVEDARVSQIDDTYYVNFSAASDFGIITRLMRTKDFKQFEDLGNMLHPDNKDVTIFPEKIGNLYYALHRPSTSEYGKPNIWIASSPDLIHWGDHRVVAAVRPNDWENGRVGASCVPLLTSYGWLEIYHGATKNNQYCLGAMLLQKDQPWKVLARGELPLLKPTESYELNGFFGNVVFSCGAVCRENQLRIYYGASDDSICLARTSKTDVLEYLQVTFK